ncbi:venom serine protease 34-like [Harmonia axyridis]|uniref:venom serine protease 34-like n=1 Tax=Harmonia axyridis TaxID=115357 RepID=UPI001E27563C|nr:venom serine protease 34-like [Harmonia axyridis]
MGTIMFLMVTVLSFLNMLMLVNAECDCGWKQGMRIVGGQETGVNEYPFMSALVDTELDTLYCGASIISERYALTAAHCVVHKKVENIVLLVGEHNVTTGADTPYSKNYDLDKFIINPDWDAKKQKNDIALLKTKLDIEFSVYVGPVCLPFKNSDNNFDYELVTLLGWGLNSTYGVKSDVLKETTVMILPNDYCYKFYQKLDTRQMCAYGDDTDSCNVDSGGPLIWWDNSTRRLQVVGLISAGRDCAGHMPSINVRVTSYLSWIVSSTPDVNYCKR